MFRLVPKIKVESTPGCTCELVRTLSELANGHILLGGEECNESSGNAKTGMGKTW
jgi:hypothetical protein